MPFTVYIFYFLLPDQYYIGPTADINDRVFRHNGNTISTVFIYICRLITDAGNQWGREKR